LPQTGAFPSILTALWGKRKEDFVLVRIIRDAEGHYDVQVMELGKTFKWNPDSTVIECECGRRLTYTRSDLMGSIKTCECGKDSTVRLREEVIVQALEEDQALHYSTLTSIPF
jgi:hypothetical protein